MNLRGLFLCLQQIRENLERKQLVDRDPERFEGSGGWGASLLSGLDQPVVLGLS
jgi:hypothetical protein